MSESPVSCRDRLAIRVLIAEDHPDLRDRVANVLIRGGYSVVGMVTNGSDLIAFEASLHPDVIVVDISMPQVNGLEAASQIRRRGSKAVIVCLTGYAEVEMLQAAWDAGAVAYVSKLSMLRDLVPAVDAGLQGRRFVSPNASFVESAG